LSTQKREKHTKQAEPHGLIGKTSRKKEAPMGGEGPEVNKDMAGHGG